MQGNNAEPFGTMLWQAEHISTQQNQAGEASSNQEWNQAWPETRNAKAESTQWRSENHSATVHHEVQDGDCTRNTSGERERPQDEKKPPARAITHKESKSAEQGNTHSNTISTSRASSSKKLSKKSTHGQSWSEEEHARFLDGLERFGKGDWRSISRHCVITRTPTQVASHAQKFFLRQSKPDMHARADATRQSVLDKTTDAVRTICQKDAEIGQGKQKMMRTGDCLLPHMSMHMHTHMYPVAGHQNHGSMLPQQVSWGPYASMHQMQQQGMMVMGQGQQNGFAMVNQQSMAQPMSHLVEQQQNSYQVAPQQQAWAHQQCYNAHSSTQCMPRQEIKRQPQQQQVVNPTLERLDPAPKSSSCLWPQPQSQRATGQDSGLKSDRPLEDRSPKRLSKLSSLDCFWTNLQSTVGGTNADTCNTKTCNNKWADEDFVSKFDVQEPNQSSSPYNYLPQEGYNTFVPLHSQPNGQPNHVGSHTNQFQSHTFTSPFQPTHEIIHGQDSLAMFGGSNTATAFKKDMGAHVALML